MLDAIFHFGSGFCHQLPERSFFFSDVQMPLCSRCSGIYFAFVVTVLVLYFVHRKNQRTEQSKGLALAIIVFYILIMAFDGLSSYLGFRDTNNWIRLATGSAMGVALASLAYPIVNDLLAKHKSGEPVYKNNASEIALLLALPLASGLLYFVLGSIAGIIPFFLTVDLVLFTFGYVILVLVALIPPFSDSVETLKEAAWPVLISIVLGGIVLSMIYFGQLFLRSNLL